jgi:hypothetical protein
VVEGKPLVATCTCPAAPARVLWGVGGVWGVVWGNSKQETIFWNRKKSSIPYQIEKASQLEKLPYEGSRRPDSNSAAFNVFAFVLYRVFGLVWGGARCILPPVSPHRRCRFVGISSVVVFTDKNAWVLPSSTAP